MFEKWAITLANQIKKMNPEETAPHDVLVFGFTILFNLVSTIILLIVTGWLLGIFLITLQVGLSFMILRMLSGGAHLDHSLACSITSLIVIVACAWLPASPSMVYSYIVISIVLVLRYAPYYEKHQMKHSLLWERKKKRAAIIWLALSLVIYEYFGQPGFVFGAFLQAGLLTPIGITFIHKLNAIVMKGGEGVEKIS
ncbi:accessory gene regulator ArgB-like protein [Bacillus sp. FSL K6-3431]|uniref:accessory gene regulator ArgB-like protein n=1 Tax=Bacillus sp. FSL K6-3431 TaxID=2921500 RepID=UPI0030F77EAA